MTVSLALRGKMGVSKEKRKEIIDTAQKLGYQPDPEVAKLLSRIRTSSTKASRSGLGLLTFGETPKAWRQFATERRYVEGAVARARDYGYRLEEFWMNDPDMPRARLSDILWNRGIEGVVIAPLLDRLEQGKNRTIDFDFSRFAAVEISETVERPDLDRAMHDQYTSMQKCCQELALLGYQRIGLVLEESLDLRVNGKWSAAFLHHRQYAGGKRHAPPLLLSRPTQSAFDHWFERHKPDVIVSVDGLGLKFLAQRGLSIPQEIGYVSLDLDGEAAKDLVLGGIDQNSRAVGAAAIDLLISSIQGGRMGVPSQPVRMEIEGKWVRGGSVRHFT